MLLIYYIYHGLWSLVWHGHELTAISSPHAVCMLSPLTAGMYEVYLGEHGRAAEVIKLRHHQSMIKSGSDFAHIALQLGLKERSQLVTHISKGAGNHNLM